MENKTQMNLTIRDFMRPIFRHKFIIVFTIAIISVCIYILLLFQTPVYQAHVLMHIKGISQTSSATYDRFATFNIHMTQMAIVTSNPVIKRTVQALKLDKRPANYEKQFCHPLKRRLIDVMVLKENSRYEKMSPQAKSEYVLWKAMKDLKDRIETVLQPNTDLFYIIVRDYDAAKALEIANVLSRSYIIYDLQQQHAEMTLKYGDLHPTVQQLRDNIYKMTAGLHGKEISDTDAIGPASVKIIEQASTDYKPMGRPKSIMMIVGFIVSCFVGFALAFISDMLNQTFKGPDDIVKYLEIAVLGTIPKKRLIDRQLIKNTTAGSLYVEFYNDLCDQLFIFMKVQNLKTLLFVSVNPSTSNASIIPNLGLIFSRNQSLKTLIIDANLTKPSFRKLFKLNGTSGFANMLDNHSLNARQLIETPEPNLNILQAGTASENTMPLLNESKSKTMVTKIFKGYDAVLIDCTFIKKFSDIAQLSTIVDGVVFIINEGNEQIKITRSMLHTLKLYKATIIGGILANRTFPIPNWLYKRI